MIRYFLLCLTIAVLFIIPMNLSKGSFHDAENLPVACNGRFCSMESAARQWLYDFYHAQHLKKTDLTAFDVTESSAVNLLWMIHLQGHDKWDNAPFFWVRYAQLKSDLQLPLKEDRFSFHVLKGKINGASSNEMQELTHRLNTFDGYVGNRNSQDEAYALLYLQLEQQGVTPDKIGKTLENSFPLPSRLRDAGTTLKMLPLRAKPGEWVSLHALEKKVYDPETKLMVKIKNFTSFSDADYGKLQKAYFSLVGNNDVRSFSKAYEEAYETIAAKPYRQASGKALYYPSMLRLKAETFYYKTPLIEMAIAFYAIALALMLMTKPRALSFGIAALLTGFIIHSSVLALRCYILQRPPVSNMFETVVYVPWVALLIGWIFYLSSRSRIILGAAAFTSLILLVLLKLTQVDARFENVQAVLDSQYWLIIHVLMVVGSYGAFAICGILGHVYLINSLMKKKTQDGKGILHTMYFGVALLIPGTILGGVWAAESWGRFWDWDPKESWAFITACVYLLVIHAYTFHRIKDFGLAVGAVAGLLAVSFTWYGVNYILGTGLHSYGFGSGGETIYFIYVAAECLFLISVGFLRNRKDRFICGDSPSS
ncbi:MAG: cytochrome c biogenesis protein CcsA [Parachlamydiaceae bacterium]